MENLDFLQSIENAFTGVGTEKRWKKKVAGRVFTFSVITYAGSHRWKENVMKSIEADSIIDSRRLMLSEAIKGIDDLDFSHIDASQKMFEVSIDGKKRIMNISEYLAHKMLGWDSQLIEDLFNVYADITESLSAENLKDVVFENVRDPKTKLADLTTQVNELRAELGLDPLIDPADTNSVQVLPHMKYEEEDTPPTVDVPDRVNRYTPIPSMPAQAAPTEAKKPFVPANVSQIIESLDAEPVEKVVVDPSKIDVDTAQSINPRFRPRT